MADESVVDKKPHLVITIGSMDGNVKNRHQICEVIEGGKSINAELIFALIMKALAQIWPGEGEIQQRAKQIILFLSDGAAYMKKTGRLFKERIAPHLLHILCFTHGLHLLCEKIRKECKLTSEFMSLVKYVMCNSPKRQEAFSRLRETYWESLTEMATEMLSEMYDDSDETLKQVETLLNDISNPLWEQLRTNGDTGEFWDGAFHQVAKALSDGDVLKQGKVQMPPHPCNTRFGTWIVAVNYYHHFWKWAIMFIKSELKTGRDEDDSSRISKLKLLIEEKGDELKAEIDYVYENYRNLPIFIARSENEKLYPGETEELLGIVRAYLQEAAVKPDRRPVAEIALAKFNSIISVNKDLNTLFKLVTESGLHLYSPTTTIRIERAFSVIKYLLGNRRHFNSENAKMVIECTLNMAIDPEIEAKV